MNIIIIVKSKFLFTTIVSFRKFDFSLKELTKLQLVNIHNTQTYL